jgi:lipoprotein-releasing system permease protein
MDLLSNLARSFEAVGGSLAVGFIIVLAAGILAMTLVYVGSALLVLDRFARVARGWLGIAIAGLTVALFATVLTTVESIPADSVFTWDEWRAVFARHLSVHVASCALFVGIAVLATRLLSQHRLANVATTLAALGVGLSLVGAGQGALAAGAWAVALAAAAITRVILRLREAHSLTTLGRLLWMTCLGLLPGAALALPAGEIEIQSSAFAARAGLGLLGFLSGFVALGLIPLAIAGFVSMRRSVEWFIAIRYLVAKRRQVFISAITAICVGGIAAGVWLIIVVLSVMNGFEQTWREEILGNRAHFTVHSTFGPFTDHDEILDIVSGVSGVEAASPYLDAEGMVRGSQGQISSVRLRGIDPRTVGRVTDLEGDLVAGSLNDLRPPAGEASGDPGIIVGNHLALSLGLGIGDTLLLISPFGGPPTPLGPGPRLKRFRVVGIFQSSFYQYDEIFTYTSLEAARDFRKTGEVVDGIEARTTDHYRSVLVGRRVSEALGYPYYTRDWKEVFPAFFQALKTERVMMFLLLTMIMVVAAFVIVATLVMMIMEKSSDIAILKAMGAEDSMIERIFALEGTLIGLLGTTVGVAAGIAVTGQLPWIQQKIEAVTGIDTLPASVYQFSELPSKVDPVQVVGVAAIAMILSLGATLLPSRQGARIDPAEGLRHE